MDRRDITVVYDKKSPRPISGTVKGIDDLEGATLSVRNTRRGFEIEASSAAGVVVIRLAPRAFRKLAQLMAEMDRYASMGAS